MKVLINIALLVVALLLGNHPLQAQSEQLERDIRIAERILEEIFTVPSSERVIIIPSAGRIQGEYIPGIGVHFKAGQNESGRILIGARSRDQERSPEPEQITDEWVESRITEYFTQYAGQLRGLPGNEQVRVTFGSRSVTSQAVIFSGAGERQATPPRLTMWVSKADIDRYSQGNISESQFISRISKHTLADTQENRDFNIFASVLETAMNSVDSKHLRVNRKPVYEYLPGLGVHFNINISGATRFVRFPALEKDVTHDLRAPYIEFNRDSLRVSIRSLNDSLRVRAEEIRIQAEEIRRHAEEVRLKGEEIRREFEVRFAERDTVDLSDDVKKLTDELKAVIKEYSSTLSSLQDGEMMMITINWSGRNPTVPERSYIRMSKEDLIREREPIIEEIRRR